MLNAAWALMEREGVAALSLRERSRSLGIRPQSLAYYFPTKATLLDALFRDGFCDLAARLRLAALVQIRLTPSQPRSAPYSPSAPPARPDTT